MLKLAIFLAILEIFEHLNFFWTSSKKKRIRIFSINFIKKIGTTKFKIQNSDKITKFTSTFLLCITLFFCTFYTFIFIFIYILYFYILLLLFPYSRQNSQAPGCLLRTPLYIYIYILGYTRRHPQNLLLFLNMTGCPGQQ